MSRADCIDHLRKPRSLCPAEFCFFQIDVMNHFGNGSEGAILQAHSVEKDLKGGQITFMGKVGVEHIKTEFLRLGAIAFGRDELKSRLFVDKPADEPSR